MDQVAFRHFSETHPGFAPWGLGSADVVGLPNSMDLSHRFGMVYGEGTPGGTIFHLGMDEKHGRDLAPFLNISYPVLGVPKISQDEQSTCCVWIAKSPAIPRLTNGVVGILSGSSCGVVTAYSLGTTSPRDQRYDRGQLTARWILSPGVPIVAISADDNVSEGRSRQRRVWAVALNALGEVFRVSQLPTQAPSGNASDEQVERLQELAAWKTGQSVTWAIVNNTSRTERSHDSVFSLRDTIPFVSSGDHDGQHGDVRSDIRRAELLIGKKPFEIRAWFNGWDMRRRLEVDFACDNDKAAGEVVVVIECGFEEDGHAEVKCYNRLKKNASSEEWMLSRLTFGRCKVVTATTSALDTSFYGSTTLEEDGAARQARGAKSFPTTATDQPLTSNLSPLYLPGQRARMLAVGTAAGTIFLWDVRSYRPSDALVTNSVTPLRVIHTDSPGISSLALTALYLVHGGEEGLVQAWDPLASTLQPIRTLSSRHAINNRRRAVIAAQLNPNQARTNAAVPSLAASAICLDPDPTVLRGIVAIGPYLKYWSYSSISAAEDLTKSQKRRLKRGAARGVRGSQADHVMSSRRVGLKDFVDQEMLSRELDERERRNQLKEDRRLATRFGLDLLGRDAGEEDMLAYAKMLSQEQHEQERAREVTRVPPVADLDVLEAQRVALSEADAEKWKFASWQQRFEMASVTPQESQMPTPTAMAAGSNLEGDLAKAMDLSLREERKGKTPATTPTSSATHVGAGHAGSSHFEALSDEDPDVAEAIAKSLADQTDNRSGRVGAPLLAATEVVPGVRADADAGAGAGAGADEDDLAKAIRLSLEQHQSASERPSSPLASRFNTSLAGHEDEFPTLSSSSRGSPSTSSYTRKGKGKRPS